MDSVLLLSSIDFDRILSNLSRIDIRPYAYLRSSVADFLFFCSRFLRAFAASREVFYSDDLETREDRINRIDRIYYLSIL